MPPAKKFFSKHAKSSAAMTTLVVHALLILVAVSYVSIEVFVKEDQTFEANPVKRPRMQLKKLQVPVKMKKERPKPKLRKRVVVKEVKRKTPEFKMPEITGIKGGMAGAGSGLGGIGQIGFSLPEINFFGARAMGEKVCFVVHFGPATIGPDPFTRMTGYTIRNRLEDMVNGLPDYALFNVISYYSNEAIAFEEKLVPANSRNKKSLIKWMEPVNPLEGEYNHAFASTSPVARRKRDAAANWPTRVDDLDFYSMKWAYPYSVPEEIINKYIPEDVNPKRGRSPVHWNRAVTLALTEFQPDSIFILTTNYIDMWGTDGRGNPEMMVKIFQEMCRDYYGPNRKEWPTINVVVLSTSASALKGDTGHAKWVLDTQFGAIWKAFNGEATVLGDIRKHMNDDEKKLFEEYAAKYAAPQP